MPVGEGAIIVEVDEMKEGDDVVNKFVEQFHEHGIGCGNEIARLAKEMHPKAIAVIPLYRSCIVVEQSDDDKKEGVCILHGYADPHWLGGGIDIENLQRKEFHARFIVQGHREGPGIYLESTDKGPDDESPENEDTKNEGNENEGTKNGSIENECTEKDL